MRLSDRSRPRLRRAPICGEDYLGRISGPLMDRFDLRVEVPPGRLYRSRPAASGDLRHGGRPRRRARAVQAARFAAIDTPGCA
jgi:magnesium chelatase family protein